MGKTGFGSRGLRIIMRREWHTMLSRPVYVFALIVAPLLCLLFFTTLLHGGQPAKMAVAVVDLDNSATSRKLTRTLDAFQHVDICYRYASVTEARRAMQEGRIYGFFLLPRRLEADAYGYRRPTLSFYVNYAYLVAASLVYQDMKTAAELAGASATLTTLQARGATTRQAMGFVQPTVVEKHPLNNPWLNYSVYLTNTLVPALLSILVFLLTAFSVSGEVKRGKGPLLLRLAHGSVLKALVAKLLPYTLVWTGVGLVIDLVLYGFLRFPLYGGAAAMPVAMLLLVLASQGVGVFFFGIVPQVRFCMAMCSLWGVVSVSMCGLTFPVMAMYPGVQGLAQLFPLRHYFLIYCDRALNGLPLLHAWPSFAALALFALLPLTVLWRVRRSYVADTYMP